MQLKVGILMGGFSEEKEISILSGNAVAAACIKNNFSVKKIIFEGKDTNLIKSAEEVDIIFNAPWWRRGKRESSIFSKSQ